MRKGKESKTYKEGIGGIWEKDEYGGEEARKIRYNRRKRFQEERTTREIYGKDTV